MRYHALRAHVGRVPVRRMCRLLAVSPSDYYAWVARPESPGAAENRRLVAEIRGIHAALRRTYGSPRVHATLQAQGQRIGEHRVARLMRMSAIRAKTVRKWRATTISAHRHPVVPNTRNRQFAVAAPNRVWAGDITYVWTAEGWLYLAVVLTLSFDPLWYLHLDLWRLQGQVCTRQYAQTSLCGNVSASIANTSTTMSRCSGRWGTMATFWTLL
jgi:putative transposase